MGEKRNVYRVLMGKSDRRRDQWQYLDVGGRIILR
jgi:hypothetical protein